MEEQMKHFRSLLLAAFGMSAIMGTMAAAQSPTQPLGDYARAVRKQKPSEAKSSGKTFDNDNLPNQGTLSVVGAQTETAAPADKDKDASAKPNPEDKTDAQKKAEKSAEMKPGQSAEERQKAIDVWKQKIDDQKTKTDLLSRELDVTRREYQLRSNAYYSDVSNRLRRSGDWEAEEAKYKQQIADKQKALDEATAKLSDLTEQAHKAGVPNSAAE